MKTINPNFFDWLLRVLAVILVMFFCIMLLISLSGCNPEKIAARKDAKALSRVEADVKLLNDAWHKGSELWPCANDTTFQTKTDTLITVETHTDLRTDTLNFTQRDTLRTVITKTIRIRDTVAAIVVDKRLQRALQDTIFFRDNTIQTLSGQLTELRNQQNTHSKDRHLLYWVVAATIVATVVAVVLIFKLKT